LIMLTFFQNIRRTQINANNSIAFMSGTASPSILVPNSESVGFQSLGPGTGDTKMHAPKNRNSPGTLLEPFPVGLQSWALGCLLLSSPPLNWRYLPYLA
jgi:hypothetical protein